MWGKSAYGKDMGKGGYGKGYDDPYGGYGKGLGGFGMGGGGYGGGKDFGPYGKGYGKAKGGGEEWGGGEGGPKKKSGGGGGVQSWSGEVPGFKEALAESFQEAGVTSELEDLEELIKKCEKSAQKQAKTFFNDERSNTKMTGAACKSFLGEFVEAVMGALSGFLYEKAWFDKVSFNGALLMLTVHTFASGKIFTRTLKTDIMPFIDDALLAWSEEERVVRQFWHALEAAGITDKQRKKGTQQLVKAYDDAHFDSPYGTMESSDVTPEVAMLQEFLKGFMTHFKAKASVLENGLADASPAGQVAALTAIFQTLMDPDSPCMPLSLQPSVPAAPWAYIEQCATEVVAEA